MAVPALEPSPTRARPRPRTPRAAAALVERLRRDAASLSPAEWNALAVPVGVGLLLPFALERLLPGTDRLVEAAWLWFLIVALPVYAVARVLHRWAVDDEPILRAVARDLRLDNPFTQGASDVARVAPPFLTAALLAANFAISTSVADPWAHAFAVCEPGRWTRTVWLSTFVHADEIHLVGNLVFLWIFASVLEGRIPRGRLLGLYLGAGLAANAVDALGAIGLADPCTRSIGASGAVAGLMGLFLVRCPRARLSLTAALGLPLPLAPRVRVPAALLVGVYFALDLAGASAEAVGEGDGIAHMAHVGGYLFGVAAGYASGAWRAGVREAHERYLDASDEDGDLGNAVAARDALLTEDPDHVDARLARARARSEFERSEEAARDYEHAIHLLLARDRRRAAELFLEYWRKYLRPLAGRDQLRLTPVLLALGKHEVAAQALALVARAPGVDAELAATARAREARILEGLGLGDAAAPSKPLGAG